MHLIYWKKKAKWTERVNFETYSSTVPAPLKIPFLCRDPTPLSDIRWQPTCTSVLLPPPEHSASCNPCGPSTGTKKSHEMCQEREGKGCKLERLQRRGAPKPVCQGSQGEPSTTLKSILTLVQNPPVLFINIHPSQKRCCPHTGWSLAE